MKIVTLNPPFLKRFSREARSPAIAKSGTFYYPMWLAYATGYLEKNGHEVKLIDAVGEELSVPQTISEISNFNPKMVVVDTSTPSIYNDIDVASEIKKELPDCFIVMVGPHVSACPEDTLQKGACIDAIAMREYDGTLVNIASKLDSSPNTKEILKEIKGIAYRDDSGEIKVNEECDYITDLDVIPFVSSVYKKHLKIGKYFYSHSRYPIISLVTGRGCPHKCTYCVLPQAFHGHTFRRRSIQNVVSEFKYIAENFPEVKEIMLEDDTITADKQRCKELAISLIEAKATTIHWSANARADLDIETLRLMRKAGCRLLCVGFESGNQQILNNIKKGTTLEGIRKFMKNARKAGVLVHGCFMVGNRGESIETLQNTLNFAKLLSPDTAQFFPIMVYPGTSDFEYYNSKGWISTMNFREWITPEGLHSSVISNPSLKHEELVKFCYEARKSFYLRPSYIISKIFQTIRNPLEMPRLAKGFLSLARHIRNHT